MLRLFLRQGRARSGDTVDTPQESWSDFATFAIPRKNPNDRDARVTIRVDPEYADAMQKAARELGINQSIMIRLAVQAYIERREKSLSPDLFRRFKLFRENRKRGGMM
jgi:hypothetical protein